MNKAVPPQGWQAQLELEYGLRDGKTLLRKKRQSGPLAVQRSFYPEGDICHNYLLHPPGGVVGGDSLKIDVKATPGAHCLLTTPGATKFYRSKSGHVGSQTQRITISDDAVVEWLPQQNIFFDSTNAELRTQIDIAPKGKFVGWEVQCFGRPAGKEPFTLGSVRSRTEVKLAGELRLLEQFQTQGDATLASATGLRGLVMQGTLIAAPCSERQRELLEQILQPKDTMQTSHYPYPIGLTLVDEVLIVRALGEQAEPILALFTQLWSALRGQWLQRPACLPRIWAT